MKLAQAIRTRRTHKAFGPDALAAATLDELLELAAGDDREQERLVQAAAEGPGDQEDRPPVDRRELYKRLR